MNISACDHSSIKCLWLIPRIIAITVMLVLYRSRLFGHGFSSCRCQ